MVQVTQIEDVNGEWEALYINGQKVLEPSLEISVTVESVLRLLQEKGILLYTNVAVVGPGEVDEEENEEILTHEIEDSYPDQLPQDLTTLPGFQSLS